jgi:hypothetical protein
VTLRTPFDFDYDPPGPHGEKMVSVSDPLGSAGGARTYYLSRRFNFTEGEYTFIMNADDAATLWLGTTQFDSRIILSCVLGAPATNVMYIPQGDYRLDVILQNLPTAPTPCYFGLVILDKSGNVVYASDKTGWMLDDSSINDDDLPPTDDVRFSLPVFSTLPNWENGIMERLIWQTDVLASETDAEQRRSVRRNARRQFEVSFLRQRAQRNRIDAFLIGIGAGSFMVPLWHEQVRMADGLDMEATGVTLDNLALREFRKGDLVFVNNGDPDEYDVLQVGDVEATRFSWAFPPQRTWPVGTRIYPMREARIYTQPPQVTNITDTVARAQILFDLSEPYEIPGAFGSNLGGEPLFHFAPDWTDGITMDYMRKSFTVDNQTSAPYVIDHGRFTTTGMQVKLRLFGRSQAYAFRQFIQAARGRAKKFMCPTFTNDLYPMDDVFEGDTLVVRNQGFRAAISSPQPLRIQLAFQFHNGAPTLYRTVTNAATIYDGLRTVGESLSLDAALPSIRLADLKRISFITETRFDQDQFEIHHPSSNQVSIDVAVALHQFTDKRTPK